MGRLAARSPLRVLLCLALLVPGWGALSGGCAKRERETRGRSLVDRSLMACLGAMRAYHRQADLHLARGDHAGAVASVEQIVALKCASRENPEVQEAVLDAYGRLARLHLKRGALAQAGRYIQTGLKRPGGDSFFRANLHTIRGDWLDLRATGLDRAGKRAEADALRRQAIQAFEVSARMNRRLLEELVE